MTTYPASDFTCIGDWDNTIPPSSLLLKLAVTYSSVKYFVQSVTHSQIIFFGSYDLHHIETDYDLAQRLERITEKDEILQLPFSKTIAGIDTDYDLQPAGLPPLITTGEETAMQHIPELNLELRFASTGLLVNKLKLLFSNCEVVHLGSVLLKIMPGYLQESNSDRLFVNVDRQYFDVLHFSDAGELQMMNRYNYKSETDFLYFLLLCAEELKIDREKAELMFSGEVDIQSKIYGICYTYFRNITFVKQPAHIHFTKAFELVPKHFNFNLYNLHT